MLKQSSINKIQESNYNSKIKATKTQFNNLKKWGIKLRESFYKMKTHWFKTDSGYFVRSPTEVFISNFLFHNEITHIYEKKIGYKNYKCDFYVPDCNLYIEYWGMVNNKKYRENLKRKLETYKQLNLSLLSLFPSDNLGNKLRFLLNYSKTQKKIADYEVPEGVCIITKEGTNNG